MSAQTLWVAAVQVVVVAIVGRCAWAAVQKATKLDADGWEWPEHALFSLAAFVGFACALMVANLVLGGAIFGVPVVVPLIASSLVVAAVRRAERPSLVDFPWRSAAAALLVLGLLYLTPGLLGGSSVRTGDPSWHLGWTQQLLHGEPVPTGPAPDFGRNAYPWGYHAVVASMTRLVPGSDPLHAQEALHVLLVLTLPLAAACLARRLDRRAGWAGAGAAALVGGFGWVAAKGPEFATSPRLARFGADLVVASPNSLYELFPPAFPRELGLVLLGATAVMLATAARSRRPGLRRLAGVVAGLAGLVSLPMFVAALAWIVAVSLAGPRGRRGAALVDSLVPAGLVFAVWAGPVASSYFRFGGFVNVTPQLGAEWPVPVALWSWGLLVPAAAAGLLLVVRSPQPPGRALIACTIGTTAMLVLALVRARLGLDLAGNATLLHQGRVWPPAHLLASAFAGVAAVRALWWLAARRERLAAALGAVALAVSAASPVLASARLAEIIEAGDGGFVFGRDDFGSDGFARRAAGHLRSADVVDVDGSSLLAFLMFSFSGARIAEYDDQRLEGNDLRIRYADLADAWNRRMAAGGFDATWRIVPLEDLPSGSAAVETGFFGERTWALIRSDAET
ncbi:MAG TPA: hypothetical protein VM784_00360 [Actinomycetota bacterium]|nr:hypothetical protein [Actinomycetota bacterium]